MRDNCDRQDELLHAAVAELRTEVRSVSARLERIERKLFDDGIISRVNVIWWVFGMIAAAVTGAFFNNIGR